MTDAHGPSPRQPLAVSHVTTITPDLDRYRGFYEDVIGLRTAVVVRMNRPPHLRHAVLPVDDRTVIHVFEQPGFDPTADGIGTEMGHRGRIDRFGFLIADHGQLQDYADRLRRVGASDGEICAVGPVLTVQFTDPDGFQGEINARDQNFDSASSALGVIEALPDPTWFDRLLAGTDRARQRASAISHPRSPANTSPE